MPDMPDSPTINALQRHLSTWYGPHKAIPRVEEVRVMNMRDELEEEQPEPEPEPESEPEYDVIPPEPESEEKEEK